MSEERNQVIRECITVIEERLKSAMDEISSPYQASSVNGIMRDNIRALEKLLTENEREFGKMADENSAMRKTFNAAKNPWEFTHDELAKFMRDFEESNEKHGYYESLVSAIRKLFLSRVEPTHPENQADGNEKRRIVYERTDTGKAG